MSEKMLLCFMLLVICVSLHCSDAESNGDDVNTKMLVGILMCKRHCNDLTDCSFVVYNKQYLSCQLQNNLKKPNVAVFGNYRIYIQQPLKQCRNSKIAENYVRLQTRRGPLSCVKASTMRQPTQGTGPRILIAPYLSPEMEHFRQINLDNTATKDNPYINMRHVLTVAYISMDHTLLISQTRSIKQIVSCKLDNIKGTKVWKRGIETSSIAVDERNQKVFVQQTLSRSVFMFDTDGADYGRLPLSKGNCHRLFSITTDLVNRIYGLCHGKLISVTYQGKGEHILIRVMTSPNGAELSFDSDTNAIYYNGGKILSSISLNERSKARMVSVLKSGEVRKLVYQNGRLYISYKGSSIHAVEEIDLKTRGHLDEYDPYYKNTVNGITFCIIW